MTYWTKAALLMAGLALSACNDRGGFGSDNGYDDASAPGIEDGSASDPSSAAYFQQNVGDRVLFAIDQSTLSEEGRLAVLSQANWLMANPAFTAVIEGHADEQGTREYNLALGARRANAVQELLVSQGVAANRISTVSFGKERPIQVCSEESCYTQNRRAVTVLASGLTG